MLREAGQALQTRGPHARPGTGAFPAPPPRHPPAKAPGPRPPRDPAIPASPAARPGGHSKPCAGPEPTSSRYLRPQRRERRAGGEKMAKTLPAHPKSQPHPPHPSAPAAPGRPPRSSAQAPAGFPRRRAGSAGTRARVGVNGGCATQAGCPPRCHPLGPCSRGALLGSAVPGQARRPQAEVGTRAPPTHPLASSRAGPPRQRES